MFLLRQARGNLVRLSDSGKSVLARAIATALRQLDETENLSSAGLQIFFNIQLIYTSCAQLVL